MTYTRMVTILAVFLITPVLHALQVRVYPNKPLYIHTANPQQSTYDVIAHLVLIQNDSNEVITLEKTNLQFLSENQMIQEQHLNVDRMLAATKEIAGMSQQGMQVIADIMVPPDSLGKDGKLGTSTELQPNQVLVVRNIFATLQTPPDALRIVAYARNSKGEAIQGSTEVKTIRYKSSNSYTYPLKGAWFMQAVPNVTSHHRWMSQTEFGIDFLKVDNTGMLYQNEGKRATDYYAYGEPVLAVADGVVVTAINDATQNWDAWLQREGETDEQFEKRSSEYQLEAMKKDLYRAVTGNLVVIEHPGGEYSAYAHLKQGSVKVKSGDRVKQGEQIAEVGDTGDYYMAHLHFQISDSPDLLQSRSLPFEFADRKSRLELGFFSRPPK